MIMAKNKSTDTGSLLTRRSAVSGLALGGAGLMAAGLPASQTKADTEWTLDLDSA